MTSDPPPARVAVVVTTKNSARTLRACLAAIRAQTVQCDLVVVDNFSTDGTDDLAREFTAAVITQGPERCRQRNVGANAADPCEILAFIDSDMVLTPLVVEQSLAAIHKGNGAVVVSEESVGGTFWARVRAFERSFYVGHEGMEAARFFRRDLFWEVGGYDEALLGGEDWDLTMRVAERASVGRVVARIDHDEEGLGYIDACRKKAYYAQGLAEFTKKHGRRGLATIIDRPYLRQPWRLAAPHPLLGLGLLALKGGETVAVFSVLARARFAVRAKRSGTTAAGPR